jgi:predicted outer membrane repeat protein
MLSGDSCGTNEACDNSTGNAICSCLPGFVGPDCETCVRFVDIDADGAGNGLSWEDAFNDPRPATIDARSAINREETTYCQVWIADGTYSLGDTGARVTVGDGVHVFGGFAGDETSLVQRDFETNITVIDGSDGVPDSSVRVNRLVRMTGTSSVDGLTLQNGAAVNPRGDNNGGAILVDGGWPAISNCTFRNNSATGNGGAIYVARPSDFANVNILSCLFENNTASGSGGAVDAAPDTFLVVEDSEFYDNVADRGGALSASGATVVRLSTFSDNQANVGGGISLDNVRDTATVDSTWISGNIATNLGGGVFVGATPGVTLENLIISGNTARLGGGVSVFDEEGDGSVLIRSSTIANNVCALSNCGLEAVGTPSTRLVNTIVARNWGQDSDSDEMPTTVRAAYSLTDSFAPSGPGNLAGTPGFLATADFGEILDAYDPATATVSLRTETHYSAGVFVVIGRDGVARSVTSVDGNDIVIDPAPSTDVFARGAIVEIWSEEPPGYAPSYRLTVDSMCIDAATSDFDAPTLDFNGDSRSDIDSVPNTGGGSSPFFDIGALEYQVP